MKTTTHLWSYQKFYIFRVFFVALGIQYAMRMCRFILSSLTCPAQRYFPILSHIKHDCRKKVTEHKMRGLLYSTKFD